MVHMKDIVYQVIESICIMVTKNAGCTLTFPNVATIDSSYVCSTSLFRRLVPSCLPMDSVVSVRFGHKMLCIHIQ